MCILKSEIREQAFKAGFDTVHFTTPDSIPRSSERLGEFLALQRHGQMNWMETHADRRGDPLVLWPDARSVIVLGLNYGPGSNPLESLEKRGNATVSVYAKGKDYHDIVKKKLKQVAGWLHRQQGCEVKVFVDTAPVMEKPLAEASGLGWQGKHTNLVSRDFGSWLFLGSIFTTHVIEPDEPGSDHCGACTRCLDICPTKAFPAPYQLDARRCISYLTIEHKEHIAEEFRENIGNRVYGCDDCLAVCPWNKFAQSANEVRLAARTQTDNPPLEELLVLDDAGFRNRFSGTPIKRTGRDRFVRNVLIAAGNSKEERFIPLIEPLLGDESPLVRAMAVWALKQLCRPMSFSHMREAHMGIETDGAVLKEWQ